MEGRRRARAAAREAGGAQRARPEGPEVDAMRVAGEVTRIREGQRRELAETEKRDAGD